MTQGVVDAPALEELVGDIVRGRFVLAKGMVEAAQMLAAHGDGIVRRNAMSRAYYGAYQAARATVFAVERRDVDSHEELPKAVEDVLKGQVTVGELLTELKRLRHEADYSPYPGPSAKAEYQIGELDDLIQNSIRQAVLVIERLENYLANRR